MSGHNCDRGVNKILEFFYCLVAQCFFGGRLEPILQMNSASLLPTVGKATVVDFPHPVIHKE